jgi:hypothetical protein
VRAFHALLKFDMRLHTLALLSAATMATGCASIVSGTSQPVSVETRSADGTQVTGANCRLNNNKGTWFLTSPGSTSVSRSFEALNVQCDKQGLEPGLATVKSSTKAMAFGNVLLGGPIGAGVDMATGAAFDYPNLIAVTMGRTQVLEPPRQEAQPK